MSEAYALVSKCSSCGSERMVLAANAEVVAPTLTAASSVSAVARTQRRARWALSYLVIQLLLESWHPEISTRRVAAMLEIRKCRITTTVSGVRFCQYGER